ncbi:MAG TPA: peptide chain release factor N(5)-glutamine methyltransferase [Propionibacteriaceae bacterium]|nr:peptide chain release factor N(5)-glutamine methyltransferase [Propionibacteriaceae bacterium]
MTRPDALVRSATTLLTEAGVASPASDARTLLAHALDVDLTRLLLVGEVPPIVEARFADLVRDRATGRPTQHLTGVAHFRHVSLAVGPGVFVPRPETEVMVGWAIDALAGVPDPVIVELCAGSGAISLALVTEVRGSRVHAVELSEDAVDFAERNLAGTTIELRLGDMATAFPELDGSVDLVIANPPYIPLEAWESVDPTVRDHDPGLALWSGDDGLDAMRVVARVAGRLLRPGGLVCAEHAEVQVRSAPQVFLDAGFAHVRDHIDLAGRPRFVSAQRPGAGRMDE